MDNTTLDAPKYITIGLRTNCPGEGAEILSMSLCEVFENAQGELYIDKTCLIGFKTGQPKALPSLRESFNGNVIIVTFSPHDDVAILNNHFTQAGIAALENENINLWPEAKPAGDDFNIFKGFANEHGVDALPDRNSIEWNGAHILAQAVINHPELVNTK